MKHLILFVLISFTLPASAATRYWVGGGSSANWSAVAPTNWSATSGGSNNASVPGSSDDVIFNGLGAAGNSASTISTGLTIISLTFTAGYTNTVTQGASVTVIITGTFTDNTAHSWTVNGTNGTTLGAITMQGTNTITSGGKTYPGSVNFTTAASVKTLVGSWTIGGTLATPSGNAPVLNWTTNETLTCGGITATNSFGSGTAKIILTGGTWGGTGSINNDMDIAGNVTLATSPQFNSHTLTYLSGTVTTTGSTLTIIGTCTLNTAGITWNNITLSTTPVITLNSALTATGTLAMGTAGATFGGSFGFTVTQLTATATSVQTYSFNDGVTYTVTGALTANTARTGSNILFTSDHGTNTTAIVLSQGATCSTNAHFTRVNAAGGRTIRTFMGTLTGCTNIQSFQDLTTIKN